MLIGRDKELFTLEGFYQGAMRLKVAVVEGRPGSGKTALCREFVKGKPTLGIWNPSATDEAANLRKAAFAMETFIKKSEDKFPLIEIPEDGFKSWGRFFSCLCAISACSSERIMLAIDDYPALVAASPSFNEALDAAVDVLWATHIIMLLNGNNADLAKTKMPFSVDVKIATSSNTVRIRTLGSKATLLGKPQSGEEFLKLYSQKGGVPGRYTGKETFPGTAILDQVSQGEDSPEAKLYGLLSKCPQPVFGMTAQDAGKECGMGKLEATRVFKSLKRLDLLCSEQLRWYEMPEPAEPTEPAEGEEPAPAPVAVEKKSERIRLFDMGDIAAANPEVEDWSWTALLDLAKEWMWTALRSGAFPNEFEELAYWMAGPDTSECHGILGVNGHYKRIVGCSILKPGEELTRERLDQALALAATLPYTAPHCCVIATVPVSAEVMEYAGTVKNLTIGQLGADGIQVLACPWQQYSERYKATQEYLAQKAAAEAQKAE